MSLMYKLLRKSIIEFHTFMVMWHRIFIQILVGSNWFRKLFGYNLQYSIVHKRESAECHQPIKWDGFIIAYDANSILLLHQNELQSKQLNTLPWSRHSKHWDPFTCPYKHSKCITLMQVFKTMISIYMPLPT